MKFESNKQPNLFKKRETDSEFAKFVRIQAEVERIFYMYNESDGQAMSFSEINSYLDDQGKDLQLDLSQKKLLFKNIDKDNSNNIDKEELGDFIQLLIQVNEKM